jgi:hypothetical protein
MSILHIYGLVGFLEFNKLPMVHDSLAYDDIADMKVVV